MVIATIISNDNCNNSSKVELQREKHHRKKKTWLKLDLINIFVSKTRKEIILSLM